MSTQPTLPRLGRLETAAPGRMNIKMKKFTIVLTITALAAALAGAPANAQSLPSSLARYNQSLASQALSAPSPALAQSLLSAINLQRSNNGLRPLTWDPALAAAATYQETADVATGYYGKAAVLADGRSTASPAQAAADFGSPAAAVAECESTTILQPANYGNATLMVAEWKALDPSFSALLSSSTPNACGIGLTSRYNPRTGSIDSYWAIFFGTEGTSAPAAVGTNLGRYNAALASAALQTVPTTLTQSLLSAINLQRSNNGLRPLTWDPALAAAATYQETADVATGYYGKAAVLADGRSTASPAQAAADFGSPAAAVAECESTTILQPANYGNATLMVAEWKALDPSFSALLSSSTPNACGIGLTSRYNPRTGSTDSYWAIFFGTEGTSVPPHSTPTLNLGGLNAGLASAALHAPASADETALLAALNYTRAFYGSGPLTPDAGLTAAAHYQAADDLALGRIASYPTWAYSGNGTTQVQPATLASDFASPTVNVGDYVGSNDVLSGRYLYMTPGGWLRQLTIWRSADMAGFGAMLSSGAYNACGIAVVSDGTASQSGVSYAVKYYVLLVGRK